MRRAIVTALLAGSNAILIAVVLWQAQLLRQRPVGARESSSEIQQSPAGERRRSFGPSADNEVTGLSNIPAGTTFHSFEAERLRNTTAAASNPPRFDWRQVESSDYRTYVQNLRAIGCPDQTIRDIVSADVLQALAARRQEALTAFYQDFKYWKADSTQTEARAQLAKQRSEIDEESTSILHQLLGADFTPPPSAYDWKVAELDKQLAFLSPERREQTKSVLLQYSETEAQTKALASNQNLTENLDERRGIMNAYDKEQAELARLLSADELDRVRMTTSWTADNLRKAMVHFDPSEEEFRIIFHQWLALDQNLARFHANAEHDPGNLQDAVFSRLKDLLGDKRYQEYRSTWWE